MAVSIYAMSKVNYDLSWMEEKLETVPVKQKLYKFICFISFRRKRKFTFKEMFVMMRNLNKKFGERESSEIAMYKTLELYNYQNGKYPAGFVKKND